MWCRWLCAEFKTTSSNFRGLLHPAITGYNSWRWWTSSPWLLKSQTANIIWVSQCFWSVRAIGSWTVGYICVCLEYASRIQYPAIDNEYWLIDLFTCNAASKHAYVQTSRYRGRYSSTYNALYEYRVYYLPVWVPILEYRYGVLVYVPFGLIVAKTEDEHDSIGWSTCTVPYCTVRILIIYQHIIIYYYRLLLLLLLQCMRITIRRTQIPRYSNTFMWGGLWAPEHTELSPIPGLRTTAVGD